METQEFARLAPALRLKALAVGMSFFADGEAAEDAAQETLIRLWRAWDALPSPQDAERMAVRLCKHECINAWRREQSRPHTSLTIVREQTHPASGEGHSIEENELREAIARAAGRLRRSEQKLWRMFAEAGMRTDEIAAATGIKPRTVSSMLSHARTFIYSILKEGGYIDE